jgi:hypothetical protein
MQRFNAWFLVVLANLPVVARAQSDWIDEFPSVTAVAHGAFQELKVTGEMSKIDMTSDHDSIAVNLAGTFAVLRQIMFLKYKAEQPIAEAREGKLRKLVAAYMEAELTIGRGAPTRRGYITREPGAGGQGCRVQDRECYRRWFLAHFNANSGRAEYRERVLKRLFPCGDLAKELNDLRQANALKMPYFATPAVTLQIDPELAGLAPAGCNAYGGDANRNGLCDHWEIPAATSSGSASAPEPTALRIAEGGGLRVAFAKEVRPGTTVALRVVRSDEPAIDAASPVLWCGIAVVEGAASADAPPHAIVAKGTPIEPEESRPYLVVDTTSSHASNPAYCEQPLPKWLKRQLTGALQGLHGPYASADAAALSVAQIALNITGQHECGLMIGLAMRVAKRGYYTTTPVCGESGDEFTGDDYKRSFEKAFETSCEEVSNFAVAATVHTHPKSPVAAIDKRMDYFSMNDFSQAALQEAKESIFEKIYMISKLSRCVEAFVPKIGDRPFTTVETYGQSVGGQIPAFVPLYLNYVSRMETIKCY